MISSRNQKNIIQLIEKLALTYFEVVFAKLESQPPSTKEMIKEEIQMAQQVSFTFIFKAQLEILALSTLRGSNNFNEASLNTLDQMLRETQTLDVTEFLSGSFADLLNCRDL